MGMMGVIEGLCCYGYYNTHVGQNNTSRVDRGANKFN